MVHSVLAGHQDKVTAGELSVEAAQATALATFEAARAGEAGNWFAIVAAEPDIEGDGGDYQLDCS